METFDAYEIYPTKEGWELLKDRCIELYSKIGASWNFETINYYFNKNCNINNDNSFRLNYSFELCNKYFSEFMYVSEFCIKESLRVESSMEEFLRICNITYTQFVNRISKFVDNEDI